MRVKIVVEYDGTNFCGWQIQPKERTVQQVLEDAVFALTKEKTSVTGSGRTDSGVHAEGQVAHFDVKSESIPANKYKQALNALLPNDVKVLDSEKVKDDFHSVRDAKRKTYRYSLYKSEIEKPLKERYALKVAQTIDVKKMEEVAQVFVGTHDFKCTQASGSTVTDTVRTIYEIKIEQKTDDINIFVTGNGFLYNMVRIIVGALVFAGEGKLKKEQVEQAIEQKDRKKLSKTVSAKGLCLVFVEY